jgi:hypothetical protein
MTAKWKEILGAVAPMIGTAVGGPLGGLALSMVGEALGLPPADRTEKGVKAAVENMSPEQYTKMQEADLAFKARLKELEVDEEKIHAGDRASARARHMKMGDRTTPFLAVATVIGFFATLASLFFSGDSLVGGTRDVLMAMVGILGTITVGVYNYYFGSSTGSKAKTDLLGNGKK